ncbi:putative invertase inhibitor [Aristolochia californica]|uniref:putative invertase inhibitor n=1 Tax=Aristolochia californica TaxID=171875 RepID=UPI0035DC802B
MGSPTVHVSLLLQVIIPLMLCTILSLAQTGPETGLNLIRETCSDTNFSDLCVSSFLSDPESTKVYYKDLGAINVKLVQANATDTLAYIEDLLENATDPAMKECLQKCQTNYNEIIDDLQSAFDNFENMDFEPIEGSLEAAKSKAEACEEGYKKHKGLKSPLTERNEMTSKLADNGFVIVGDMMI